MVSSARLRHRLPSDINFQSRRLWRKRRSEGNQQVSLADQLERLNSTRSEKVTAARARWSGPTEIRFGRAAEHDGSSATAYVANLRRSASNWATAWARAVDRQNAINHAAGRRGAPHDDQGGRHHDQDPTDRMSYINTEILPKFDAMSHQEVLDIIAIGPETRAQDYRMANSIDDLARRLDDFSLNGVDVGIDFGWPF